MQATTPMMQQYLDIKNQYKDHILFFRLGDFYEMFFDDAKKASAELDLTLTGRDCGQGERAPMCGVPYHSCESYIARLIQKGYKIAICEQLEDPALAKGLVKRDIVRIITPGTVVDSSMLEEGENNFLASIYLGENGAALAFADISTGEVSCTVFEQDALGHAMNELGKFGPKEVLANPLAAKDERFSGFVRERLEALLDEFADDYISLEDSLSVVTGQFGQMSSGRPEVIFCLGRLLKYIKDTQMVELSHMRTLNFYLQDQYMEIDLATKRNLEITENMQKKEKRGSLLGVLDKTKSAMGGRLIRKWLEQPLLSLPAIQKRLNAVAELKKQVVGREELCELLSECYDLERLIGKIVYGTANARDLRSMEQTLRLVPRMKEVLAGFESGYIQELVDESKDLSEVYTLLNAAIVDDPPFTIREGGIIKDGYRPEVDELRRVMGDAKGCIARMENEEREKTGIKNLKIGYNRVFGYYIEVTRSYYDLVPETYIRKQTLSNCERFITQELKEFEGLVLGASEKITALEYHIFQEVKEHVASYMDQILKTASAIAQLDVLCSFAAVAAQNNYVMPEVDLSGNIQIKEGRHPVVEKLQSGTLFVPNDTSLDLEAERMMLITGPNMAGKSTYMRQVALIVLMAQTGSFVPAKSARIGVCDKIFTRVGASDDLSAGQSTFMVEMSEVANILKSATRDSLIVYDEIGRGTSTFDGLSIAQAVLEYTADKKKLGAKTLFATHYHELTELEGKVDGVKNYCIAVKKHGDDITFLRKIIPGAADDSDGIEVAKLAGVPDGVTQRAKVVLRSLEETKEVHVPVRENRKAAQEAPREEQVSLLDLSAERVVQRVDAISLDTLTPIEALNLLYELKRIRGEE